VRNTIKEQRQEIRKLSNENEKITNKYKALLKKVQREAHAKRKSMQSNEKTNLSETVPETPRGKA
jgi:methyl-accepting chemotaxis protein